MTTGLTTGMTAGMTTLLSYRRLSTYAPPEREMLEVSAGGAFRMWRSVAPAAGRFGGVVPDVGPLRRLRVSARAARPPSRDRRLDPDASVETIVIGDVTARVPSGADVPGPWGQVLDECRRLVDELCAFPRAALALEWDGPDLALRHLGSEALPVELGSAVLEVYSTSAGTVTSVARVGVAGSSTTAGPGFRQRLWSVPADAAATALSATLDVVVSDAGVYVPLSLSASTALGRPER